VKGEKSRANLLNASLALFLLGNEPKKIIDVMKNAQTPEHRMEFFFRSRNNVSFYNDSAATIPEATCAAISSFEKPPILITGGTDKWQRPYLTLTLSGCLPLQCQRCMQPTEFALNENVRIVLFENEETLDEAMLADEDLEGMLQEPEIDVFSLIEDQILMALPFSPKHEQCGNAQLEANNQSKPNPFAVLAGLKKSG